MRIRDKILATIFFMGLLIIICIEAYGFSIGEPFNHPLGWKALKALWLWALFWGMGWVIKFIWEFK